jgi:GH24 family phage-related lysozyme (muramidase)
MSLIDKAASYIEKHEGRYVHMYLDHKGLVTVGVGYYLPLASTASALPFRDKKTKKPATKATIEAEWKALKALNLKNYKATYFDKKTTLELTDAQVTSLFKNKTLSSRISLNSLKSAYDTFKTTKKGTIKYSKFDDLPEAAQIALWDMAYCLGIGGLKVFKKLLTACKLGEWKVAETACKIANTPSQRRNNDNKAKFQEAARQEAAKSKANKP